MTTVIHSFPVWLPQTQTWMYNQVRFLPERVEAHVVCERTENLDQFAVPNIHALQEQSPLRYVWDKGLVKLGLRSHSGFLLGNVSTLHADLVHSHFGPCGWRDMHTCRKAGIPQIVTFYGADVNLLPTNDPSWCHRYRDLFDSVALVLGEGPHLASCLVALGCPEKKVRVHHLGIALDDLPFKPRVWNRKRPLRILLAGSFREKKGIPYALEALGRLQGTVGLEVTLIGDADRTPSSQEEKRRIMKTIENMGLTDRVRLLGYQSHARLLQEAYEHHIHIAPSITASNGDTEGGAPVTLIEMAATGMPVVSSKHCDIPEIIEHDAAGLLVEEKDVDGLVTSLKQLIDQPDRWRAMVTRARRHIAGNYSAMVQGRTLAEIYREVLV